LHLKQKNVFLVGNILIPEPPCGYVWTNDCHQ